MKINKVNEIKNFGYSESAIELLDYSIEFYKETKLFNELKNIELKYWVLAYHMFMNFIVRDKEGLDTSGKDHARCISNTKNSSDSMFREILRDFVLKMLNDDGIQKKYTDFEYAHYWLNNDKVFNIMRSVAEYDFEIQTNLFKSIQQPLRNKHGFELYIKIGDWCALEDSSFSGDSYLRKAA